MEVAGLAISVAGLATLFDACLRGFDLFEQGKDFSRDHAVLMTRLDAQRTIFAIWGDAVGIAKINGSTTTPFLDPQVRKVIKGHLDCISLIFEDASQLGQKYGLKRKNDLPSPQGATPNLPLRSYLSWFQKQTSRMRKAKWVIRDLAKFKSMLDDLSNLIRDLREITSSLADIQRQREIFTEEISQCGDIEDLEIMEEALSEEDPALSSAASERLAILTGAPMTIRSISNPKEFQDQDDDMQTHADSDADAQSMLGNDGLSDHIFLAEAKTKEEKSLEILAEYGHQNNLDEIQKNDLIGLATVLSQYHDNKPLGSKMQLLLRDIRELVKTMNETPFISLGFAANQRGAISVMGYS